MKQSRYVLLRSRLCWLRTAFRHFSKPTAYSTNYFVPGGVALVAIDFLITLSIHHWRCCDGWMDARTARKRARSQGSRRERTLSDQSRSKMLRSYKLKTCRGQCSVVLDAE